MISVSRRGLLRLLGAATAIAGSQSLWHGAFAKVPDSGVTADSGNGMETLNARLSRFVRTVRFEDLPDSVVKKTKEQIAFFFGRAFEGAFDEKAKHIREVTRLTRRESGGVTVIGERFRLDPAEAAFANCSLMRGSTRDDVIFPAGIHAGVITLPTALAIGEDTHCSGKELMVSVVVAYEVLGKLGRAGYGWAAPLPRRPTNIYGGFGPVSVAGRLLELDQQQLANAMAFAANLGMGIPEGGMMQHYYSFINRNGILAAQLAAVGAEPYKQTTLEGQHGLYRSFFGEIPDTLPGLMDSLGSDWEILKAERKLYPGTGANAVAIELLFEMVNEDKLTMEDVVQINVFLHHSRQARNQEVSNRGPFKTRVEAYSSLPYALALVLHEGELKLERYSTHASMETINDPQVATAMTKVQIAMEQGHTSERWCRLEVRTRDGRHLVRESDQFKFPFPPKAWGPWLQQDGHRLLPIQQLESLERAINELEDLDDVADLMATVVPPPEFPSAVSS